MLRALRRTHELIHRRLAEAHRGAAAATTHSRAVAATTACPATRGPTSYMGARAVTSVAVAPTPTCCHPAKPDMNSDGIIDWSPRRDLVPSGVINILDVNKTLPPFFGYVCT